MAYLIVKWLHILSATLLVGTGFGSAFYLFFANRSRNSEALRVITRLVVLADWTFTLPAVVFQLLSGIWLAHAAGFSLGQTWLAGSLILFVLTGLLWLPVVWLQLRMRDMADQACATGSPLPPRYWRYTQVWTLLGVPAFSAMLVVYWLMVSKPS